MPLFAYIGKKKLKNKFENFGLPMDKRSKDVHGNARFEDSKNY